MFVSRRAPALLSLLLIPAFAVAGKKKAAAPMPDIPKPPPDQEAAMLWQAGTLAASRGDYGWAIKKFESCLKVQPKHAECKYGLKDTRQKLGWNPKPKKKRKPAPKPAEGGAEAAAGPSGDGKAEGEAAASPSGDGKADAVKHWNAGILHHQKGEFEKAREEWQKCKELDPNNQDCATGLDRLAKEYGPPKK